MIDDDELDEATEIGEMLLGGHEANNALLRCDEDRYGEGFHRNVIIAARGSLQRFARIETTWMSRQLLKTVTPPEDATEPQAAELLARVRAYLSEMIGFGEAALQARREPAQ